MNKNPISPEQQISRKIQSIIDVEIFLTHEKDTADLTDDMIDQIEQWLRILEARRDELRYALSVYEGGS